LQKGADYTAKLIPVMGFFTGISRETNKNRPEGRFFR
jgi:hypothetical protein